MTSMCVLRTHVEHFSHKILVITFLIYLSHDFCEKKLLLKCTWKNCHVPDIQFIDIHLDNNNNLIQYPGEKKAFC